MSEDLPRKPLEWIHVDIDHVPAHIIALHRLARIGRATKYGDNPRFVHFDVTEKMSSTWNDLAIADKVYLIYREKKDG